MQIAALVFDAITPLDIVGPIEVLARMPGVEIVIVAKSVGRCATAHALDTHRRGGYRRGAPADILVLPGGAGVRPLCADESVLEWLRHAHARPRGPPLCAPGRCSSGRRTLARAHRHHALASRDLLEQYGARYVEERVVQQGKIITSAGVSSASTWPSPWWRR